MDYQEFYTKTMSSLLDSNLGVVPRKDFESYLISRGLEEKIDEIVFSYILFKKKFYFVNPKLVLMKFLKE
jgi:hypothetical protein